jgi:hypothetical protein
MTNQFEKIQVWQEEELRAAHERIVKLAAGFARLAEGRTAASDGRFTAVDFVEATVTATNGNSSLVAIRGFARTATGRGFVDVSELHINEPGRHSHSPESDVVVMLEVAVAKGELCFDGLGYFMPEVVTAPPPV